jgi:adenosylhomocysteinase
MAMNADPIVDPDILDLGLAEPGRRRTEWVFQSMPVLQAIRKQFIKAQPLAGFRVLAGFSISPETANLLITLRDGGAQVTATAPEASFKAPDLLACLSKDYGIPVLPAAAALATDPHWILDQGGRLLKDAPASLLGATLELASAKLFSFPVISIDQAQSTHLFDHRYGVGQSVLDGVLRCTNLFLSGITVVIAGYGWCGRGIATRARGMGANVIITEIDPTRALEALMDGNRVMSMAEAAAFGDLFLTATGNKNVIGRDHFDRLKSGAIIANAGHAPAEIDLGALDRMASSHRPIREAVEEYVLRDGRRIQVLALGQPVNAASGQPTAVRDISLAIHALSLEYLSKNSPEMPHRIHPVPEEIDRQVARLKLEALGLKIDRLTPEQEAYLATRPEAN